MGVDKLPVLTVMSVYRSAGTAAR